MKKRLLMTSALVATTIVMMLVLTGCGSAVPERIIGEWTCEKLASDEMTDTSFYTLTIEEDGTFSLYDKAAGNPGISGKMKGDDTGKLGILELDCTGDDFDPPACWGSLDRNSRIRYKMTDDSTLKLGYVGIWLTFH